MFLAAALFIFHARWPKSRSLDDEWLIARAAHGEYDAGCVCCAPAPGLWWGRTQEPATPSVARGPPTPGIMAPAYHSNV